MHVHLHCHMHVEFFKYQGTGNDFIIVDNFNGQYNSITIQEIQMLCDRKFGIGADGFIRLNAHKEFDLEVDYFNADGSKSFCGNGTRCAIHLAFNLAYVSDSTSFWAIDGAHEAKILPHDIALKMSDVSSWKCTDDAFVLNTGSPHFISFKPDVQSFDLIPWAKSIRFNDHYREEGINVNAVEVLSPHNIRMRTYERGVEDETLSCGTGATAAAICHAIQQEQLGIQDIEVQVPGGNLTVRFELSPSQASHVWLIGPAKQVFRGEIEL